MDRNFVIAATREILQSIHTKKPLDDVVQEILKWACQLTNSVHGSFITVDHSRQELCISSTYGPDWTPEKKSLFLPIGRGITGQVAATGKPYLCSDASNDPYYIALFDFVQSELAVPVIVEDRVWGIINFDGLKKCEYNETSLADMELFAQLAAAAIDVRLKLDKEQRLQHELMQAEKLASLGKLLAGIAHEINNPLTAILGGASVLAYDCENAETKHSLEAIAAEAQRAADLVKNLLAFSRRQSTQKEIREINDIVKDTCSLVRHQLKLRSIRLSVSLPDKSPLVEVNPLQIQQVLLNILNNAEHAIEEERRNDGDIRIDVSEENGKALVQITDNGIGMEMTTRQSIYDPFFTTKDVGKGTGLGLSIAHSIVTSHGGLISCTSGLHAGSVFTLQLPVATRPSVAQAYVSSANSVPPPSSSPTAPKPIRILLVDDEDRIRSALSRFLQSRGLSVSTAADGQEAQELAHGQDFDIVLSDIRMPRMGGFELYQALLEIDSRYRYRFVFMTGDLVSPDTQNKIHQAAVPYVEKPFQFEKIHALVLELTAQ